MYSYNIFEKIIITDFRTKRNRKVRKSENLNAIYKKYEKLRDNRSITDHRVAEDADVTRSTFSDWHSGRSYPKFEKLQKIAAYFDASIEYFLE